MYKNYLFYIFSILLILSTMLYIIELRWVPYVYATASVGMAIVSFIHLYRGDNFRLKRLNIQQTIAVLILLISAYFQFKGMNEWTVCLLVSAVLQTYIVFVRNYEEKKNHHETDNKSKE